MPDTRARHYWDPSQLIGKAYQEFLGLAYPAWDIWMVFDPGVGWDS